MQGHFNHYIGNVPSEAGLRDGIRKITGLDYEYDLTEVTFYRKDDESPDRQNAFMRMLGNAVKEEKVASAGFWGFRHGEGWTPVSGPNSEMFDENCEPTQQLLEFKSGYQQGHLQAA